MGYFFSFINNSTIFVKLLLITNIFVFISYLIYKYKMREYIFSPFNISIFISAFALLFISMLQYNDKAWEALGSSTAIAYIGNLNENMIINNIGFLVFIFTISYFEFFYKGSSGYLRVNDNFVIKDKLLIYFYVLCVALWWLLIIKVGAIPVFGNRMIFDSGVNNSLRPIYLALNIIIVILVQYIFLKFINTKKVYLIVLVVIGIIIIFCVGSRGPFVNLIANLTLFYIYSNRKRFEKPNLIIVSALLITLVLGIGMLFIRHGNKIDTSFADKMEQEVMYGNTFSDIRDGAFVLNKYEDKFDGYLYGKNYLADLMSFVPSSLSSYRQTWSWGNFTAKQLAGYEDHYGLRGGMFLQPYVNFSWIGVLVVAIILGIMYGLGEKSFHTNVLKEKDRFELRFIIISLGITFANSLSISSGFHDVYPLLALAFIAVLPKAFTRIVGRIRL
ncbi:O-antigen polymerase [Clostridium zeae]|nr:O-antigen polymerase [Clostridium zeae]